MAFLPTNASQVQQFAVALYGIKVGTATMSAVQADITAVGGLNNALNAYYSVSFGSTPTATVAASIAANLGLTASTGLTDVTSYITAQLNAAPAGARGQVVSSILNLFSTLSSNATIGTAVTAWNTKVAAAVAYTGASDVLLSSGGIVDGQVFNLTTGVDLGSAFTGGAGNDTFNATNLTLNSFDALEAGAGTDTLNIGYAGTTAAFALPSLSSFAGFENVNVSNASTNAATNAITITNTTFGTGVQKLSYTEAGAGTTDAASVTLNSATDVSVASTGVAFTTVAVTDTSTTATSTGNTLKNVSVTKATGAITLTGNGINNVTLNTTGGLTTVTAAAGARDLTVNTAGTGAVSGLTDAQATSLTINNSATNGATAVALGTFTAAKATTVNYTSTAANASATITAGVATTLNVSGTKVASLALAVNPALTTINVAGAAGLTLTAATGASTDYAALALIDTTGSTGVLTANTLGNATAVTGGAGNDNITVGATTKAINLGGSTAIPAVTGVSIAVPAANKVTLASGTVAMGTGGSINGGTGTADVLSVVAADAAAMTTSGAAAAGPTAFRAAVTGFEVLELAAAAGAITVDKLAVGTTFNQVNITGAAQTVTLSNIANNDTIQITGANTGVTTNGSSGAGVDAINVKLVNSTNGALAFGTVTLPNTETVNVISTDTQVTPVGYLNTLTIVDTSASSIVVTGNSGLALTFAGTALTNLDASAVSLSGITYTAGALTYASVAKGTVKGGDTLNFASALAAVTITEQAGTNAITGSSTIGSTLTGGTGVDTIVGGAGVDTINGGAGADVITGAGGKDVITLGAGADIVKYATIATSAEAGGAQMDTITDFVAGTDKINLAQGALSLTGVTTDGNGDATATMAAPVAIATSVATVAEVYTALAAAPALTASAADGTATVAQIYTFANGASAGTYLVINNATAGFQAATDIVINLTGLSGTFSGTDITYTV